MLAPSLMVQGALFAGMPTPVLTEWARLRLETLSFSLLALLLSTVAIRFLWNRLARDFPRMPSLTFGKTLAGVFLWGMCMVVVLTMIAGARELLTPAAWEKDGLLYKLPAREVVESPAAESRFLGERRESLLRLRTSLWYYASKHGGHFPEAAEDPAIAPALWEVPESGGMHYIYVPGRELGKESRILVYEPAVHGEERFALETSGTLSMLNADELRRRLDAGPDR